MTNGLLRSPLILSLCTSCLWIGPSEHQDRLDQDGDGVIAPEDCDDQDPLVHPGLPETACDGRDNDCDPSTADGAAGLNSVPYASVQAAIDAAGASGVVQVCPGVARESVVLPGPITLEGVGEATLDAGGGASPVVSITGAGATLRRLVLTGGAGGIDAFGATGPVQLEQVVVRGNTAELGAGVRGPGTEPLSLQGCTIEDNASDTHGGGLYVYDLVEIVDSLVQGNSAVGDGGGIYADVDALVVVSNTTLEGNTADRGGGGWIGAEALLEGGTFTNNEALQVGGGVYAAGGSLLAATLTDNTAPLGGGLGASSASAEACTIEGNVADAGGGIYAQGAVLVGGSISGNAATAGAGGGVLVERSGARIESFSEILDNTASLGGGGVAVIDGGLELTQIDIEGNSAPVGAGLYALDEGACALEACTIAIASSELSQNDAGQQPGEGGGGIWSSLPLSISSSDMSLNTGRDGGALYLTGGVEATLTSGTLVANSASERGGALFVSTSDPGGLFVDTVSMSGNAASLGSALHVDAGVVAAANASMVNHTEGDAAIHLAQAAVGTNTYLSVDCTYDENAPADLEVGGSFDAVDLGERFECTRGQGPGDCVEQIEARP